MFLYASSANHVIQTKGIESAHPSSRTILSMPVTASEVAISPTSPGCAMAGMYLGLRPTACLRTSWIAAKIIFVKPQVSGGRGELPRYGHWEITAVRLSSRCNAYMG